MVTVSGVRDGRWRAGGGLDDVPGDVGVMRGVGGPDAGDGFAGGLGEVGEPVGAGGGELAGVGEQDADVAVGLVAAVAGGA
jgi:hypothetical protein